MPEVKPKKKIKKKFKLATFDKEVLKLVYDGVTKDAALQERTRVDENQFRERIEELIDENLLVRSADLQLRLGIEGYNTFIEKIKPKDKPQLNTELKQKIEISDEKAKPIHITHAKPAETILPAGQEKITELVDIEGKVGRMDLEEIIKKYGPTNDQKNRYMQKLAPVTPQTTQITKLPAKQIQELPAQAAQKTQPVQLITQTNMESTNSSDLCELCKAPFILKVGDETQSKYGHCFCGAAYHKDCYDTILDDSRLCIRCGKKLMLLLNKNSRETLNELRDAFE